jgi:hypothetical protein
MLKISEFQKKCKNDTGDLLCRMNLRSQEEILSSEGDIDIRITLENESVEIWIYENEAGFYNEQDKTDMRFESYDYDNQDRLISDFINRLEIYLATGESLKGGHIDLILLTPKALCNMVNSVWNLPLKLVNKIKTGTSK